ncbi:MAG: hypothetical protein ACREMS_08385 [Gemmatimonadaceae bacterium]
MIRSRFVRSSVLVLSAFVALSCSDYSPTAPPAPVTVAQVQVQPSNDLLGGLLGGVLGIVTGLLGTVLHIIGFQSNPNGIPVNAVKWTAGHFNEVRTVSGTIGWNGGTLTIPGSDFTITFPRGALSRSTAIKIVSDGSEYVSYDMQPHGIKFAHPVIVTQSLKNTSVYGTPTAWNAFGAYFPTDPTLLGGLLKATEIETTTIFGAPHGQPEVETWLLNHFSRYMLSSG